MSAQTAATFILALTVMGTLAYWVVQMGRLVGPIALLVVMALVANAM